MNYRPLGSTGLKVSEIGFGGEWMEGKSAEEVADVVRHCEELGINILDCWMSAPLVRSNLGSAIAGRRDKWIIQGHLGSTWHDDQYLRTREQTAVQAAFDDLRNRLGTDYIDLGMIHFVDEAAEYESIMNGVFIEYVMKLKDKGDIRHIGMSTHNPAVALKAAESGIIEVILFSVNPAFDLLPPGEDMNKYFEEAYDPTLGGIDPVRAELYKTCENRGVGMTVMKGYAGGRLFNKDASPFGVALTPIQCLHYALTRPGVSSVMVGFEKLSHIDEAVSYCTASDEQRDYASVLAKAPHHAYSGQCTYCGHCAPCPEGIDVASVNKLYDLATMAKSVPATVRAHYHQLKANASHCAGCKDCESRCPFGVNVTELMEKAVELFG